MHPSDVAHRRQRRTPESDVRVRPRQIVGRDVQCKRYHESLIQDAALAAATTSSACALAPITIRRGVGSMLISRADHRASTRASEKDEALIGGEQLSNHQLARRWTAQTGGVLPCASASSDGKTTPSFRRGARLPTRCVEGATNQEIHTPSRSRHSSATVSRDRAPARP